SIAIFAEACASRLHDPTTNESNVANFRKAEIPGASPFVAKTRRGATVSASEAAAPPADAWAFMANVGLTADALSFARARCSSSCAHDLRKSRTFVVRLGGPGSVALAARQSREPTL